MKILCVADHVDPLVYSPSVKNRFGEADLVLSAGDLPMEYLGFISSSLNKPIFFVFGNHHLTHLDRFLRSGRTESVMGIEPDGLKLHNYFGSTCIEGKVGRHRGLLVAGLGGCRRYNSGDHQFTEWQMRLRILRLTPRLLLNRILYGRYLDILLTHASPLGINDRPDPTHIGFHAFIRFMDRFRPALLLHGHVHLYDINARREMHYKQTRIINVYDHVLLDFEPKGR